MQSSSPAFPAGGPTLVIRPADGWQVLDWRELWAYRDLCLFVVWRSIRVRYAQSVLGAGWAVIQPLVSMAIFTVVFGRLAGIDSEGVPYALFSYAALVPWTFFAGAVADSAASLVQNAAMISKVYFPRLILPVATVAAKLVDFGIALLLVFAMMAWYRVAPTPGVLALPLLVALMVASAAGLGIWLAALAVQYRDVQHATGFAVQLLLYAAPVVYPASLVPERWRLVYALNPMVGVVEGFRAALLGTRALPWTMLGLGGAVAALLLVSGVYYFRHRERVFADVA